MRRRFDQDNRTCQHRDKQDEVQQPLRYGDMAAARFTFRNSDGWI